MSGQKEHMRWAYLDGELSACEASEFDKNLSDAERQRLAAEMRLESALGDKLREGAECPTDLWRHVQGEVWKAELREQRRSVTSYWGIPALAAAAGIIIAFALFFPIGPNNVPPFLNLAAANVGELAQASEVAGSDELVEDYLRQAGLAVDLRDEAAHTSMHKIELLGATLATFRKTPFGRIQYMCCGQPVEIIVAHKSDPVGKAIIRAQQQDAYQGSILYEGDLVFASLGDQHHTSQILNRVRPAGL